MTDIPPCAWLITPFASDNILSDRSCFETSDLIIAIDNGLANCIKHNLIPSLLIGDLDSLDPLLLKQLSPSCHVIIHHPEKDETDTQLAVEYCLEKHINQINICNDMSGRFDHAFGIIQNLLEAKRAGAKATIYTGTQIISLLDDVTILTYPKDTLISLISLSEITVFQSSTGLKYPLDNLTLHNWQSKGISNVLTESEAVINMLSGIVLVVITVR